MTCIHVGRMLAHSTRLCNSIWIVLGLKVLFFHFFTRTLYKLHRMALPLYFKCNLIHRIDFYFILLYLYLTFWGSGRAICIANFNDLLDWVKKVLLDFFVTESCAHGYENQERQFTEYVCRMKKAGHVGHRNIWTFSFTASLSKDIYCSSQ